MGRPSKLTESQWANLGRDVAEGKKSLRELAKKYGVSAATISERFPNGNIRIAHLAEQAVIVEQAQTAIDREIAKMPIAERLSVDRLMQRMLNAQDSMVETADNMAYVSARISRIASFHAQALEPSGDIKQDAENIKAIGAMGASATGAGSIPLTMLTAQKAKIDRVDEPEDDREVVFKIVRPPEYDTIHNKKPKKARK